MRIPITGISNANIAWMAGLFNKSFIFNLSSYIHSYKVQNKCKSC